MVPMDASLQGVDQEINLMQAFNATNTQSSGSNVDLPIPTDLDHFVQALNATNTQSSGSNITSDFVDAFNEILNSGKLLTPPQQNP